MSANASIAPASTLWSTVGRWLPETRQVLRTALSGLLPLSWRQRLGIERRRLLLCPRPGGLQLQEWREGRARSIGAVPADDLDVLEPLNARLDRSAADVPRWLVLDSSQVLVRPMLLPIASEAHLNEVMAHEIDRQTPFAADQVCYQGRVVARDPVQKQLRAELVVLPKARLDAALSRLGPLAQGLAGVDVEGGDGNLLGVNLLPLSRRAARSDRNRWLELGLAALFAALVVAAMLLALKHRQTVLLDYQQRVAAATGEAREARKLRGLLAGSTAAENFLANRRARQPTTLELLADITRRLPDTTWLEKISVADGNIVLIGQSQQASSLVGLLQGSSLIVTPALTGSVQTDPRSGRERFTLTAKLAGSAKETPDAANP
jgi:general secretion pathway protein L